MNRCDLFYAFPWIVLGFEIGLLVGVVIGGLLR